VNTTILYAILTLSLLGVFSAVILYFIAQKFKVIEDPRVDIITGLLPGANCGGCGYAGCHALAETIVKTEDISNHKCPVGGNDTMKQIAKALGLEAKETEPQIAVVRCNGSRVNAPSKILYNGAASCTIAHSLSAGETGCPYGCLGEGDCVKVCLFDAIYMDHEAALPRVIEDKCVACGACVTACPRSIIQLRNKGVKGRRVYVSCINKEKGGTARKNCNVPCIGCGKCVKECPFDAITLQDNLAYIDFNKCKLCRKCVTVCPTGAILEVNFPPRKEKSDSTETIASAETV